MKRLPYSLIVALVACSGPAGTDATDVDSDTAPWSPPEGGEIVLEMFDGVRVPTTYLPASEAGRPGIVLVHGAQFDRDRTAWPDSLVEQLQDRDWSVLIPDMRGCGESEGEWRSLKGPIGIADIRTFMETLHDDGYGPIALVSGSYTDASMTAYAYQAERGEQDIDAHAMVYLSGYGSGVHSPEYLAPLDPASNRPILFQYFTNNREWAESKKAGAPSVWTFHEYDGHLLNTGLLDQNPQAVDHMVSFFDVALESE